ncbi:MAG: thioredoxin domain-containing protein, partial [Actinobacteria bacterium]|nr:thioredoxin domain-containing protein [Actinomycetota bacterium]
HKDNPVDWYPWGDEALDHALQRDQPILLSIGYAACHWCHVMERESFESHDVAKVMNEHFVCVKVDREERPDLDAVYMDALQSMTGHGGWPMTMFLTPEGVPFFGGTYFPPEDRHGLPSFTRLLQGVAEAWKERRDEVESQGKQLVDHLRTATRTSAGDEPVTADILDKAFEGLRLTYDPENGGFGVAPKFPQPMSVDVLLRLSHRGEEEALRMATRTLDAMAAGGMYDQIGGGFARYSVDARWVIPHFEKMLYDNSQLLRTYARSWQITKSQRHRTVAEETAEWVLREMRDPAGGFWSTIDADSEGVEGKFYVWSLEEFREVTGEDADVAVRHWGITAEGNFEGHNNPVWAEDIEDDAAIARARRALLEQRAMRVPPATDTKVLSAWNGLAASALAEAGTILGKPEWTDAAARAMRFVLSEMRIDGRLMRSYRNGVIRQLGFAEDYAFVLEACLSLYEATGDPTWLEEARWAADGAIRLFLDSDTGGFFTTGEDAERLVTRAKDMIDNAVPAANSVFAVELQRLSLFTGEPSYAQRALDIMKQLVPAMSRSPLGFGHLLGAGDFYTSQPLEIVIIGEPGAPDTDALLDVLRDTYIPNKVLLVASQGDDDIPLLQDRHRVDGKATAYVCRSMVCKQPVTTADGLREQIVA